MYAKEFTIQNRTGLHARPASDFVALAATFQSKIELSREGETDRYNGKSIIMLLTLGLMQGERATLFAEGEDEQEAVEALTALIAGFTD